MGQEALGARSRRPLGAAGAWVGVNQGADEREGEERGEEGTGKRGREGESEGEMEEVVDVGTIWNVGHVETVDVMAVVGGETPTNKFQITLDSGAGASCWPDQAQGVWRHVRV